MCSSTHTNHSRIGLIKLVLRRVRLNAQSVTREEIRDMEAAVELLRMEPAGCLLSQFIGGRSLEGGLDSLWRVGRLLRIAHQRGDYEAASSLATVALSALNTGVLGHRPDSLCGGCGESVDGNVLPFCPGCGRKAYADPFTDSGSAVLTDGARLAPLVESGAYDLEPELEEVAA